MKGTPLEGPEAAASGMLRCLGTTLGYVGMLGFLIGLYRFL